MRGRYLHLVVDPLGLTVGAPIATDTCESSDGWQLYAVTGPAESDARALLRWTLGDLSAWPPVRQGFAAVAVNARQRRLIATVSSRREVGLYYALVDGCLHFSSSLPELVRKLPRRPDLDEQVLRDFCDDNALPDDTCFEGVRRVPFSHVARGVPGELPMVSRWFEPRPETLWNLKPDEDAALMRHAVAEAVTHSLPPDGDVGAFLSGGLDSTMVATTAASQLRGDGRRVKAFVHVPSLATTNRAGWIASDGPAAQEVAAAAPGLSVQPVPVPPNETMIDAAWASFNASYSPQRNVVNLPWLIQIRSRCDAERLPLALSGQSGNLAFSWWGAHAVDQLVAAGRPIAALRTARQAGSAGPLTGIRSVARRSFAAIREHLDRPGPRGDGPSPEARWHPLDPVTTFGEWREVVLYASAGQVTFQPPAFEVWRSDPLSDPAVTDVALALPPTSWRAAGLSRSVARRSARGLVPDSVRLRTTRGQQSADAAARVRRNIDQYVSVGAWAARHSRAIDMPQIVADLMAAIDDAVLLRQWIVYRQRTYMAGLFEAWWRTGQPAEIPNEAALAR